MQESTARRAKEVFFDRGIARTKARDGVLIFASLLERRVVVLADEAVRGKVPVEAWQSAIDAMTAAAADGRIADGLVAAVEKAGAALRSAGVTGEGGGELGDDAVEGDTK
jgi:putative membrane protein